MKKISLVIACLAGFSASAHAQNSVTLYGIVDTGLDYQKLHYRLNGNTLFNTKSFGGYSGIWAHSRVGIKGQEELGNGTYATFQLESGLNLVDGKAGDIDNKTGKQLFFDRIATIGLKNDQWGTITLGRQGDANNELIVGDPFGPLAILTTFGNLKDNTLSNTVRYISPVFSGFKLGLSWSRISNKNYSGPDKTQQTKHENYFSLAAQYKYQGLTLSAALGLYRHQEGQANITGRNYVLGTTYNFGKVRLYGQFGQQFDMKSDNIDEFDYSFIERSYLGLRNLLAPQFGNIKTLNTLYPFTAGSWTNKGYHLTAWRIGATINVARGAYLVGTYEGSRARNTTKINNPLQASSTSHIFKLAFAQFLSKRTMAYIYAGYGWTDIKAKNPITQSYAAGAPVNLKGHMTGSKFGIALNHRF